MVSLTLCRLPDLVLQPSQPTAATKLLRASPSPSNGKKGLHTSCKNVIEALSDKRHFARIRECPAAILLAFSPVGRWGLS